MEKEYTEMFCSKPFWDSNKWTLWTSSVPIKDGYKIRIEIPLELIELRGVIEAEIIT